MRVLFDLNVVLDLLLDRQPWSADAQKLVARVLKGELGGFISAISVPTLFYVIRKAGGVDRARLSVERALQTFEVAPVGGTTLKLASTRGGDFEDQVQAASAIESGLDAVVTREQQGFTGAPIRILSPDQLEHELTSAQP